MFTIGPTSVLSAPELLKGIGDTYGMLIRLGQQLGAVRIDLPFELLLSSVQAVAGALAAPSKNGRQR